jgi:hypothetical protein
MTNVQSHRRPTLPSIDFGAAAEERDPWNARSDAAGRGPSPPRRARGDGAESRPGLRSELDEARSRVAAGNKRIAQLESWLDTIYGDRELGIGVGGGGGVKFDDTLPAAGFGLPSIRDTHLDGVGVGGNRSQRSTHRSIINGKSLQTSRTGRRTPRR